MSPQGASAQMEAQILLYLQEQTKPATKRKQPKPNQKEVSQEMAEAKVEKKPEQKAVTVVSSCRLFNFLSLLNSLSSVETLVVR
jgi:hypothetical protein